MFTPSRTHTPGSAGSSRRRSAAPFALTPRRSQISGSKTSLTRRSAIYSRSSPAESSILGSPSVSTVYNTANHSVETAGSSLPVLVNEALTLADRSDQITAEINDNGWAWLVCGKKLFVWKFKQGLSKNALCKEFSLPPVGSDSDHKSSLIHVGGSSGSTDDGVVSLLVVTPAGGVRFWPNIIQNVSSAFEGNLDGIGASSPEEECIRLVPVQRRGYLVGTSKGLLFHILPSSDSINCTRLQVSHGMLAGIGRRVSSFFFSSTQDVNLTSFITLHTSSRTSPEIVMLTSSALKKWKLGSVESGNATDHMVAQTELNVLLKKPISKSIWNDDSKEFSMWPLDIALGSKHNHVVLLLGIGEETASSSGRTTLGFVVCVCPPDVLKEGQDAGNMGDSIEVHVLEHMESTQNIEESDGLCYQLLIPNISASAPDQAIIWRDNSIIIKSLARGNTQEDSLPLTSTGDNVLGAGQYNRKCVLLTSTSGLLVINPTSMNRSYISQNIEDSILQTPSSRPQTPLSSLPGTPVVSKAKIEQLESSDNGSQRIQAAFIHFNRLNITQAKSIIEEAFGESVSRRTLDDSVIFVSQELIDDYPAQDPRWAESVPQDSGNSSNSLILLHQLQDKQKAHQLYLTFLTEVGIWENLGNYTDSKNKRKTCSQWLLIEHGEKLASAIALRQKHAEHQGVIDIAIRKVLERRDRIFDKRGLTPQDVFYREVSRIQDILEGLLDVEEDMIGNSNLSSREIFTTVAGVNEIFEAMLSSAHQYRRSHDLSLQNKGIEFSPWTVSTGRHSVREAVIRQHHLSSTRGLPVAEDGQQRAVLHSHLVSLADIILSGYQQQLDSVSNSTSLSARSDELTSAFKRHRTELLTPILDAGLIDKAANLAEKYHDFGVLVELCDRKQDQERLSQYMMDFASQGFSDFLFSWYLERGKYRKLLECVSSNALAVADYNDRLAEFLSSHPKIAWLHQIKTGDFMAAHNTLQYLAAVESHSTSKKNNLLSLSKLSAVFSNESDEIIDQKVESINNQQTLIRYQETLPGSVLEKLGVTVDTMPVFSVQKLIELYVGDENVTSNEVDFKKALDLLQFLPQTIEDEPEEMDDELRSEEPDAEAMKHYIWCRILLKDAWENIDHSSNPLEACKHTVLSKTLNLAHDAGVLVDCLPDVERLLEQEELGPIRESASSQYLIRARFEHANRQLEAVS